MSEPNPWRQPPAPHPSWPPPPKPGFRIGYALALLFCLLIILGQGAETVFFWRNSERAVATVIPLTVDGQPVVRPEGLLWFMPFPTTALRFETEAGRVVEAPGIIHALRGAPEIGSQVVIYYQRRQPLMALDQGTAVTQLAMTFVFLLFAAWLLLPALIRATFGYGLRFWPPWPFRAR